MLGSKVSCKPVLVGGGVSGAGIDELSEELRLRSCDELPLIAGGTRFGSKGWF